MIVKFIGSKFYLESGTIMSSIYKVVGDHLERTDWGKIQIALENGENVNIEPASKSEIKRFEIALDELKKDIKRGHK